LLREGVEVLSSGGGGSAGAVEAEAAGANSAEAEGAPCEEVR